MRKNASGIASRGGAQCDLTESSGECGKLTGQAPIVSRGKQLRVAADRVSGVQANRQVTQQSTS